MRFLGYTLGQRGRDADRAPLPRPVREDGQVRRRGDQGGGHRRHRRHRPHVRGRHHHAEGRRVHGRRRAVHRGQGAGRRLGAAWSAATCPRRSSGPSASSACWAKARCASARSRAERGRGRSPASVVVESVACRPPIRPPRSRPSTGSSSRGWWPRWPAFVGDIGLAEELAQDALVDALRQWPRDGTPAQPGAWLTAVGKRKAIDLFRRNRTLAAKYAQLGRELAGRRRRRRGRAATSAASPEEIDDDRLRLIFVACHPVLSRSGPGGAHAAPGRRPHGARDRPGLRRARGDDRAAHRAGQEGDRPGRRALRGAGGRTGRPVWARCSRSSTSFQRGLLGHRRRRVAAARALRRSTPARPRAGRPRARRARGPRTGRAHGVPVLPPARPHRSVRCAGAPARPGPAHLGPAPHRPGRGRAGPGRSAERRPAGPLRPAGGDRRLPRPLLPARGDRLGPAGRALRPAGPGGAVADRRAEPRRRRVDGVGARRRARPWWTSWSRRGRWSATTSSPACGAICSTSSDAMPRPRSSSIAPRRWRPTRPSAPCSRRGPAPAGNGPPRRRPSRTMSAG